jgi:nucleotide-binding universal stress UspA family protein
MSDLPDLKSMNILLAVDGSEHALEATHLLKDLPCIPHCHLTALMVIVPRLTSFNNYIDRVLNHTKDILTRDGGPDVKTLKLLSANPAEMINDTAQEMKADLIVVGAKGLRATMGILLGGVAQQVVEYATCPVLIVRKPYSGLHKVLLITDGSESSLAATRFLGRFKLPLETQVYLGHIMPPSVTADELADAWIDYMEPMPLPPVEEMSQKIAEQNLLDEQNANRLLDEAEEILRKHKVPVAGRILRRGDAATEILNTIIHEEINLVVAGSRGLSRVRSWLLGSVSRKLVHYAPCSVLVVKGEQAE